MYHSDAVIRQLQAQKILAERLDNAVSGVADAVADQLNKISKGATRLSFYASCFTDEYYDVCEKQTLEDNRFALAVIELIKDRNIIFALLQAYFEYQIQNRSPQQLDTIKSRLMQANIHIAASTLTNRAFITGVTMALVIGMSVKFPLGRTIGGITGTATSVIGIYGIVQNAADSAKRLQTLHPAFYHTLYMRTLEMMFFLVEEQFIRAGALKNAWLTEHELADVITKMVRNT